jgi:hypothetical protein
MRWFSAPRRSLSPSLWCAAESAIRPRATWHRRYVLHQHLTGDRTATWSAYTSPKWGYSVKYPGSWTALGTLGAPDTELYLSNENVGSPMSLDANGVFVAISIHQPSPQACAQHGLGNGTVDRTDPVVVDSVSSNLYVLSGQQPYMELNVERDTYCYMFSFVFGSTPTRDSNEGTAKTMLSSTFKFGQPTASAP